MQTFIQALFPTPKQHDEHLWTHPHWEKPEGQHLHEKYFNMQNRLAGEWMTKLLIGRRLTFFLSRCHPNLRIQNKYTLLFQDRVVIRKWCTKILSICPSIYQGWALGVGVHLWADSQETEMLIKLTLTLLSPLWNYLCYRIIIICMCILCGNTGSRSQYRSKLSCSWSSEHIGFLH